MNGKQLRAIRARLKLTQVQMADEVGVAPNTIARYERDELPIPEPTSRLVLKLQPVKQVPSAYKQVVVLQCGHLQKPRDRKPNEPVALLALAPTAYCKHCKKKMRVKEIRED